MMSDSRNANNDPSMDDILASIRKIISDDEARAQVNSQQAASQSGRAGVVPPFETRAEPKPRPAGDDVLMLTDLIEDSKPGDAPQPQIPLPRIDPARAAEMPQPSVEPPAEPSLVGAGVVGAATSAFARLNQAVQDSVPPPAAPAPGPSGGGNGTTVEEMLRPMLKEWLDRNLPPMVERYVEREIVRLTRR
jgi:cell pole-organizing protein PopZ